MNPFGEHLREARLRAGITQAELGAPLFSRSYVSLLESGLRPPSDEVLAHLARKLAVDPAVVRGWAASEDERRAVTLAAAQVETMLTLAVDGVIDAGRPADRLERLAEEGDVVPVWLTATFIQVLVAQRQERYGDAMAALDELDRHWAVVNSPLLRVRAAGMRASLCRAVGDLAGSVRAGRAALADVDAIPQGCAVALAGIVALVSSLAELGRDDETEALLPLLDQAAQESNSRIEAGRARWVLGNVHFLAGRVEEGLREHELAAELIDPAQHLQAWGALHRASASMRIGAGVLDGVEDLLDKADRAFSISSRPSDRVELGLIRSRFLLASRRAGEAVAELERVVQQRQVLAPQNVAEAHEAWAQALSELGRPDEAREQARQAVAIFGDIGADSRALQLCRQWHIAPA